MSAPRLRAILRRNAPGRLAEGARAAGWVLRGGAAQARARCTSVAQHRCTQPPAPYSYLSAMIGSTRLARRAGSQTARRFILELAHDAAADRETIGERI